MAGRKPKFPGHQTRPTTLRLPEDVANAIRGNQQLRDDATDGAIAAVRKNLAESCQNHLTPLAESCQQLAAQTTEPKGEDQ